MKIILHYVIWNELWQSLEPRDDLAFVRNVLYSIWSEKFETGTRANRRLLKKMIRHVKWRILRENGRKRKEHLSSIHWALLRELQVVALLFRGFCFRTKFVPTMYRLFILIDRIVCPNAPRTYQGDSSIELSKLIELMRIDQPRWQNIFKWKFQRLDKVSFGFFLC